MSEGANMQCPGCLKAYRVEDAMFGQRLQCDVCQSQVIVSMSDGQLQIEMMIACTHCAKEYTLSSRRATRRFRCSGCGQVFELNHPPPVPLEPALPPPDILADSKDQDVAAETKEEENQPEVGAKFTPSRPNFPPEVYYVFEPVQSLQLGALKDPLHAEETPYDILDVPRTADHEAIEKAFKKAFAKKGAVQARQKLRDPAQRAASDLLLFNEAALRRLSPCPLDEPEVLLPERRAATVARWEEQFKHAFPDAGMAHCLGLFWYWWAQHAERRFQTLREVVSRGGSNVHSLPTKRELMRSICATEPVIHCTAKDGKACADANCPFEMECAVEEPAPAHMWQKAIGYWAMLETTPDFWSVYLGLQQSDATILSKGFVDALHQKLMDLAGTYSAQGDGARHESELRLVDVPGISASIAEKLQQDGFETARDLVRAGVPRLSALDGIGSIQAHDLVAAAREALGETDSLGEQYRSLAAMLSTERRTAAAIAKTGMSTKRGKLCCGTLLLQEVGVLADVSAQVQQALKSTPTDKRLLQLRDVLSRYYHIVLLIDSKKHGEALEAIARLSKQDQQTEEVSGLRIRVLHQLAKEEAALGQFADALQTWGEIVPLLGNNGAREAIQTDIVTLCQARAQALLKHRRDEAITILQKAHALVRDETLGLLLADMLTQRSIERFHKGERQVERAVPAGVREHRERADAAAGREDWAVTVTELRAALKDGEGASGGSVAERGKGLALCVAGLQDLEIAAALGYKRAGEQRNEAREALQGVQRDWRETVREHLAIALTQWAVGKVNKAMGGANQYLQGAAAVAALRGPLRDAEQDLLEALEHDPSSARAKENLATCRKILGQLGQSPGALESSRKPARKETAEKPPPRPSTRPTPSVPAAAGKSSCFIATACYGNAEAEDVLTFRMWRDTILLNSNAGRTFVGVYYKYSPPLARWLVLHPTVAKMIQKCILAPLARALR